MRVCTDCRELKSLETEFVRIKGQGGWYGRCRTCRARRNRERYRSDAAHRAREIARIHRNQQLQQHRRNQTQSPAEPRPKPEHILSYLAGLADVTVDELCGPSRRRRFIDARAVALYLLRTDARLTPDEAGARLGRSGPTVRDLARRAKQHIEIGRGELYDMADRVRRALKSPVYTGATTNPPQWSRLSAALVYGLADQRRMARLTQPELAARSGIARETIGRLERLHRPARPATTRALPEALGIVPKLLTHPR